MVVLIIHLEESGGREPERDKRNGESKTNRSWFRHKSFGISERLLASTYVLNFRFSGRGLFLIYYS